MSGVDFPQGRTVTVTGGKKTPKDTEAVIVGLFSDDVADGKSTDEITRSLVAVGHDGHWKRARTVRTGDHVVLGVGLGKKSELTQDKLRQAAAIALNRLHPVSRVATTLGNVEVSANASGKAPLVSNNAAVAEGLILGSYAFDGLKTNPTPHGDCTITLVGGSKKDIEAASIRAEAVILTRDLVNTPSSHLYPETYALEAERIAHEYGLEVEVLGPKELKKQGFGGILAVGGGSARLPRLVSVTYKAGKGSTSVGLVGKGITFDTGGISIKPAGGMDDMISDMGGSASVLATAVAAARLKLPISVTAYLPMAENMPGGAAYRPGDVITHYGGITSEIRNTDAEGRLVLADGLAYASTKKHDYIIDVATLTGAQIVALGNRTSGIMGTPQLRDLLAQTGRSVGEDAWSMPITEEVRDTMKSDVADVRNMGERPGGMLSAAAYLEHFVSSKVQWAHIDIAGPSYNTGSRWGYTPKRGTGVPVRTLLAGLEILAQKKKKK